MKDSEKAKWLNTSFEIAAVMKKQYPEDFNPDDVATINPDVITVLEGLLANARNGLISDVSVGYIKSNGDIGSIASYGLLRRQAIEKKNAL